MGAGVQRWWRKRLGDQELAPMDHHGPVVERYQLPDGTRVVVLSCGCRIQYAPGSVSYTDGI